jgi:DnaJ-class molecular chaperone
MRLGNNPWDILRISPASSKAEIHAAYHALAQQHHPDKGGNNKMFSEITKAYNELKGRTPVTVVSAPSALYVNLKLDIIQQIEGVSGYVGVVLSDKTPLYLKVNILPGAMANDKFKVEEENQTYIINIQEKQHDSFTRQGFNVIMSRRIDIIDVLCGNTIVVIDPCGQPHKVQVTRNSLEQSRLIVPNKGLYDRKKKKYGHMYIDTTVEVPLLNENNINDFIKRLKNDRN